MTDRNSTIQKSPKQAKNKKLTQDDFIQRSSAMHDNKYAYEKTKYINVARKVVITCPEHGDFEQIADVHIRGGGCAKCGSERRADSTRKTAKDFICRAREVHGSKYNYDKVIYVSNRTDVVITCLEHGDFTQRPTNHLQGKGCLGCADTSGGWSRGDFIGKCKKNNNGLGKLYVIKCQNDDEVFYKIGITSTTMKERFRGVHAMPYEYTIEYLIQDSAYFIYDIELQLQALSKGKNHRPKIGFKGQTECFTTINPIEKLLRQLSSTDQLQLIA